ncbi:MAG: thioredoxin family protein [Planctomyces sp.]|nr:thioredoxin family protein [Planctomyces sp.]
MATIQILGTGCSKCTHLFKNAEDAVQTLGRGDRVEKIEDIVRILDFSPSALPAMAIDGKVVTSGMLSTSKQIQELLQAHLSKENEI